MDKIRKLKELIEQNPEKSANQLLKEARQRGLGIQRKKFLDLVREVRNTFKKPNSTKYTPNKYKPKPKPGAAKITPMQAFEKLGILPADLEKANYIVFVEFATDDGDRRRSFLLLEELMTAGEIKDIVSRNYEVKSVNILQVVEIDHENIY